MVKVLFVCMGNICRSPMAEQVFRHLVAQARLSDQFEIDSAGTLDYHVGARPHSGTQRVLRANGVDVGTHTARQVLPYDLNYYDYVLAMDGDNLADLRSFPQGKAKVGRLLDFAPDQPIRNVPDPYYMGNFEAVYDLITRACRGLLDTIIRERGLQAQTRTA